MTVSRFLALLQRHGAVSDRWPDDLRQQALRLMASNPDAAAANQQAARLESLMRRFDPAAQIDDDRVNRIIAAVQSRKGPQIPPVQQGWRVWIARLSDMLETRPALLVPRFVAPLLVAALLGLWVGGSDHQAGVQAAGESPLSQVSSVFQQSHWLSSDLL